MKTLAQIRADNALKCHGRHFGGQQCGEVIDKLPARICNNGLLAVLAFCLDKGGDHLAVADIIAKHLSHDEIAITQSQNTLELITELSKGDATLLRRATAESLALLNYMKRFAS